MVPNGTYAEVYFLWQGLVRFHHLEHELRVPWHHWPALAPPAVLALLDLRDLALERACELGVVVDGARSQSE